MSNSKILNDDQFFITGAAPGFFDQSRSKSEEEKMNQVFSGLKRREDSEFSALKKISDEKKKATRDEFEDAHNAYIESAGDSEGPRLQIYSNASLESFTRDYDVSASDDNVKRTKAMMTQLLRAGEFRKLQILPVDFIQKLANLTLRFPNFTDVFEYLLCMCHIAARGDGVVDANRKLTHL